MGRSHRQDVRSAALMSDLACFILGEVHHKMTKWTPHLCSLPLRYSLEIDLSTLICGLVAPPGNPPDFLGENLCKKHNLTAPGVGIADRSVLISLSTRLLISPWRKPQTRPISVSVFPHYARTTQFGWYNVRTWVILFRCWNKFAESMSFD